MSETPAVSPTVITVCPDGPLLVRGDFTLTAPDGTPVPANRRTVALCRCGKSTIAPWCDGSHRLLHRSRDAPPAGPADIPAGPAGETGPRRAASGGSDPVT